MIIDTRTSVHQYFRSRFVRRLHYLFNGNHDVEMRRRDHTRLVDWWDLDA